MRAKVDPSFWHGKKVFLTGHTGFKGSWLSLWLEMLGANVKGFALTPSTTPSLFTEAGIEPGVQSDIGDIRSFQSISDSMLSFDPDILIHMAAQPLVRLSYKEPVETYATNVMGTVHVLEAARSCRKLKAIVNVTTDKCYENNEWDWGYRESDPMGGSDPYSSSKGCVELLSSAYRRSFFSSTHTPSMATARAGNVIGGGDWAEERLIPDILRAFQAGEAAVIRFPEAIRPWQHVLEPLSGYLLLAERLWSEGDAYAEGWNFGPCDEDIKTVEEVVSYLAVTWGDGAMWQLDKAEKPHEAGCLKLDISKARNRMQWSPLWSLESSLERIASWHKAWLEGANARDICSQEITAYMTAMMKSCK